MNSLARPGSAVQDLTSAVQADCFETLRDFAGLDQINVKVPRVLLGKGALPVFVTHGPKTSNTLTVQF